MGREEENWDGIIFYCKDCEKIVEVERASHRKYVYKCSICKTKNVAFGTEKSIATYFHIEEEKKKLKKEEKKEKEEEVQK